MLYYVQPLSTIDYERLSTMSTIINNWFWTIINHYQQLVMNYYQQCQIWFTIGNHYPLSYQLFTIVNYISIINHHCNIFNHHLNSIHHDWSPINHQSLSSATNYRSMVNISTINHLSTIYRPSIDHLSTTNQLLTTINPSIHHYQPLPLLWFSTIIDRSYSSWLTVIKHHQPSLSVISLYLPSTNYLSTAY